MREIAISEFKARCPALLEEVSKTRKPIRITRRGKPIAEVVPPSPATKRRKLGSMAGTVKILGDIVAPVIAEEGIRQGLEDVKKGRVRPVKDFFAEFEARHGVRR